MERLTVQVATRGGRAPELLRSDGRPLAIGRAYSNDLVLTDPYVAPRQLLLERSETGWRVSVLERSNEVLLNGQPLLADSATVDSGDRLTVGRTELLLFADDHPVEPTRTLLLASAANRRRLGPALAFAVLALVVTFDVVTEYYSSAIDLEWRRYGYAGLFYAALLTVWAGLWAIAGRLLRHQPHFSAQLVATALVSLALTCVYPLADYLEFLTSNVNVSTFAYYVIGLAALTALLRANLLLATNLRHTTAAALVVAAMVVGLVHAAQRFAEEEFASEPEYSDVVMPPFTHLTRDLSIEAFLARADQATE